MSEKPMKLVVDLSKPKGERETYVELTATEIAENKAMAEESQAQRLVDEAKAQAKAQAKQSANDKLAALGLSPEEIAAITGA
jgi:hypothetical protein|tara:strand:+ start:219 stop:464 length:246 start_codon:yes stop_codon:yes gene_type:complete